MEEPRRVSAGAGAGVELIDLGEAVAAGGSGAILNRETQDLDLNLVRFEPGAGVGAHVNREVDVIMVVLDGEGILIAAGAEYRLMPGRAAIVPKGIEREIRATGERALAYLSLHRRRARLWPTLPNRDQ